MESEAVAQTESADAHVKRDPEIDDTHIDLEMFFCDQEVADDVNHQGRYAEPAEDLSPAQQEETVEKSEVFDDPMNMLNDNGYIEIPISDPEHLKKIVLTGDVTSSAGSSWATAGCAVCINADSTDALKFWTSKSYTLALGSNS